MNGTGLVLEGGGMRGVYTSGVLDVFLEHGMKFPYVIGVSAGASNAISYISGQIGRNRRVTIDYIRHPNYLGVRNLIREGSMFGWKFLFDVLPNKLEPFDYAAFEASGQTLVIGTTDAHTGEAVFFDTERPKGKEWLFQLIQASCSLPFISRPVKAEGRTLFDGGIADPIPIGKAIADGRRRNVVVLTKDESYRIKPFRWKRTAAALYRKYPGIVRSMADRHERYNRTMDLLRSLEAEGSIFVLRPSVAVPVSRLEKDPERLRELYELGRADAENQIDAMKRWLASG